MSRNKVTATLTESSWSSSESVIVSWCRSDGTESDSSTMFHFAKSRESVIAQNQGDHFHRIRAKRHQVSLHDSADEHNNRRQQAGASRRSLSRIQQEGQLRPGKQRVCTKSVTFAPKNHTHHYQHGHQPGGPVSSALKGSQLMSNHKEFAMPSLPDYDERKNNQMKDALQGTNSSFGNRSTLRNKPSTVASRSQGLKTKGIEEKQRFKPQREHIGDMTGDTIEGTIRRAKSVLPVPRKRSLIQSRFNTRSSPVVKIPFSSDLIKEADISSRVRNADLNQTVAHSQMKYWHLRKIIRDVLIRHGDIQDNECSKDIDEAISSYAVHLMFKENSDCQTNVDDADTILSAKTKPADFAPIENKQESILDEGKSPVQPLSDVGSKNTMGHDKAYLETTDCEHHFDKSIIRNRKTEHLNHSVDVIRPTPEKPEPKNVTPSSVKFGKTNDRGSTSTYDTDDTLPNYESLQIGNTTERKSEGPVTTLTSSKSFGRRLVHRLKSVFSSGINSSDDTNQTSSKSIIQAPEKQAAHPSLQDQLDQLVHRSSQLMTETQDNLVNIGNMIEHIQTTLNTSTMTDTNNAANVNIPKIQIDTSLVDDRDDNTSDKHCDELQQNEHTNTLIPMISPATSMSSVPTSRPDSPYPRIYPIINPGGDAVTIHNSYTMEEEEIAFPQVDAVLPQVDTSLDVGRMWQEANQLIEMYPPDIDVSLNPDAMWQQIMTNIRKSATSQNAQQESTKWWACPSTPLDDEASLEEANWSFLLLPKSSTSSSATSKPSSDEESSSSLMSSTSERCLSMIQADTQSCLSLESNPVKEISLTQRSVALPDDTIEKINNVVSKMEKMLSELSVMMDNLTSNTQADSSSECTIQQRCSNSESSIQSSETSTANSDKGRQAKKPSKCDELLFKLNHGLQKIFTPSKYRCKVSDGATASFHQDMDDTSDDDTIGRMSSNETGASWSYDESGVDESEHCDPNFEDAYIV